MIDILFGDTVFLLNRYRDILIAVFANKIFKTFKYTLMNYSGIHFNKKNLSFLTAGNSQIRHLHSISIL